MNVGIYLRNMGPASTPATLVACARAAEDAGLDDLWVADHVAIPPDESSGSEGRYLDPLATLAFLAGVTQRIGLGTGVLVLPYRPALPTAKWVATIQELSGERLRLGVASGWMSAEFRALGVPESERGARTDEALELFERCFADDEVEIHGQRFLFRPRPKKPPIYVGGSAPAALRRAARFGDAWMPTTADPEVIREGLARMREEAARIGRPTPTVVALTSLPVPEVDACRDMLATLGEIGVTAVVHGARYESADELRTIVDGLARIR